MQKMPFSFLRTWIFSIRSNLPYWISLVVIQVITFKTYIGRNHTKETIYYYLCFRRHRMYSLFFFTHFWKSYEPWPFLNSWTESQLLPWHTYTHARAHTHFSAPHLKCKIQNTSADGLRLRPGLMKTLSKATKHGNLMLFTLTHSEFHDSS